MKIRFDKEEHILTALANYKCIILFLQKPANVNGIFLSGASLLPISEVAPVPFPLETKGAIILPCLP